MEDILPGQIGLIVPVHVVMGPAFATGLVLILLRLMAVKTASENHSRPEGVKGQHVQVSIPPPALTPTLTSQYFLARHISLPNESKKLCIA